MYGGLVSADPSDQRSHNFRGREALIVEKVRLLPDRTPGRRPEIGSGLRYVSRQHFEDAGIVQPLETWNSLPPGRFPSLLYGRHTPGEVP